MNEELIRITIQTTIEEVIKKSNLLQFDFANFWISITAICISIWSVYFTLKKSSQANYYRDLYNNLLKDLLQDKLPQIINKSFNLNSKTVEQSGINEFEEFIGKFRSNLLVFKYINKKFYKKMEEILVSLDEKIVVISTRSENFQEKYEHILEDVNHLYKTVDKYLFK